MTMKCEVKTCLAPMAFKGIVGHHSRYECPKCGKVVDVRRGPRPKTK